MKRWIPQQHGAWAMTILPFLLGAIAAARAEVLGFAHLTLFLCWMVGYFAFHAASGWLKASPRRRGRYVAPLVTYGAVSATAGLATVALAGWRILPWALAFLPLVVPALRLAGHRRERATIGGALTIAAASLMVPVARYLLDPSWAGWPQIAALTGAVFGYFFGTVLFVKTNIRERGVRAFTVASVAWHAVLLLAATALAWAGLLPWWWVPVLAFVLARAVVVPPMRLRPMALGMIEMAVCTVILALTLLW